MDYCKMNLANNVLIAEFEKENCILMDSNCFSK